MLHLEQVTTMTTRIVTLVLSGLLGLTPIAAHAQYDAEWTDEDAGAAPAAPDSSTAAPAEQPPAPPALNSDAWGQDQATASVPPGQWIYTQQYGWIWMPYGDAYAYVPPAGYGAPYAYADLNAGVHPAYPPPPPSTGRSSAMSSALDSR